VDLAGNYHLEPRKMSSYDIKIDIKRGTEALLSLEIGRLSVWMEIHVKVLMGEVLIRGLLVMHRRKMKQ